MPEDQKLERLLENSIVARPIRPCRFIYPIWLPFGFLREIAVAVIRWRSTVYNGPTRRDSAKLYRDKLAQISVRGVLLDVR